MGICRSFRLSKVVNKLVNKPVLMPLRWACELDAASTYDLEAVAGDDELPRWGSLYPRIRPPLRPARQ